MLINFNYFDGLLLVNVETFLFFKKIFFNLFFQQHVILKINYKYLCTHVHTYIHRHICTYVNAEILCIVCFIMLLLTLMIEFIKLNYGVLSHKTIKKNKF